MRITNSKIDDLGLNKLHTIKLTHNITVQELICHFSGGPVMWPSEKYGTLKVSKIRLMYCQNRYIKYPCILK